MPRKFQGAAMSLRIVLLAAAAVALAGCVNNTSYASLYPKPLKYRHGVPQKNFGYGPLPTPDSRIPIRPKHWLSPDQANP
jgi:hypothetical protein